GALPARTYASAYVLVGRQRHHGGTRKHPVDYGAASPDGSTRL
ncbi:MAG: hypothetical protein AVDCRST_MAG69-1304, partial [uncultured Solirubrobacteraceae bacterium]